MKDLTAKQAIEMLPEGDKVHSFRSFIGADWDRESVIESINTAKRLVLIDDIFGHNLAVQEKDDKVVRFQVKE